MTSSRVFYEGDQIPGGWGFVTYDYARAGREYAPMPVNWMIRLVRWSARKSQRPLTDEEIRNSRRLQELSTRSLAASVEDYNRGYGEGYKAGWEGFYRAATSRLDQREAAE